MQHGCRGLRLQAPCASRRVAEMQAYGLAGPSWASLTTCPPHPTPDLGSLAGIVIPDVVDAGSSSDVLVVSWVEGEPVC